MKLMKHTVAAAALLGLAACTSQPAGDNPLLGEWDTPFGIPPFEKIEYAHYMPAILEGIKEHNAEIQAIIDNQAEPDWHNTILALDNSGQLLDRVAAIIFALSESDNTPQMQEISEQAMPLISAHQDEVGMNAALFARIKAVYDQKDSLPDMADEAQMRLLEKTYKRFVRSGALLNAEDQEKLATINAQLTTACLNFTNTLLAATKAAKVVDEETGEVYAVDAAVRLDVLTNSPKRELRQKMYETYTNLGSGEENNTAQYIDAILRLRQQKAELLGFKNYAEYKCDNVMSGTPEAAYDLLMQLWEPAIEKVKEEVADMEVLLNDDMRKAEIEAHPGCAIEDKAWLIQPWDYYYYAEKVKAQRYNLTENDTKPYFELSNVVNKGIFNLAKRLYGVEFTEVPDAPKYNPEVTVYELKDAKGEHVAVFMFDPYARDTKVQGAWMSEFRGACNYEVTEEEAAMALETTNHQPQTTNQRPIIYNVLNLAKPAEGQPCLLTLDEVQTVFHEFGHALQGMLTRANYRSQAGTNVDRDCVELPSQINEKWATEPELLREYALHYETNEVMPDSLIAKLLAASKHNQGFMTTELVGAALLDLEWHMAAFGASYKQDNKMVIDPVAFEEEVAGKLGLPREVQFRYRSPYFKHIFGSDGYASGYYTYLWADVLVSDAYDLFRQNGPFDRATADLYRQCILEPGDSRDPMELFVRFRGHKPEVGALLRDRGLAE